MNAILSILAFAAYQVSATSGADSSSLNPSAQGFHLTATETILYVVGTLICMYLAYLLIGFLVDTGIVGAGVLPYPQRQNPQLPPRQRIVIDLTQDDADDQPPRFDPTASTHVPIPPVRRGRGRRTQAQILQDETANLLGRGGYWRHDAYFN